MGLEGQARQTQAEWLLENLRKHDQGMNFLVKGLLLSEIQDFLAREILEDESFEENGHLATSNIMTFCLNGHLSKAAYSPCMITKNKLM
ncbi:hypothetical protein QZH41_008045 [Actinostola sp. cb2023]|nr:hypothetical protein QZH41_008045 [Actinostola sp. cb2023]